MLVRLINMSRYGSPAAPVTEPTDEYVEYVSALLHFNGSNNSTTITDETGKTAVAVGDAKLSNTLKKYGLTALYLDGSDSVTLEHQQFACPIGTPFTIECWVYLTSTTANVGIFNLWNTNANLGGGSAISVYTGDGTQWGATDVNSAGSPQLNTWTHVAYVNDGRATARLFINGTQISSGASARDCYNFRYLTIGRAYDNSKYTTGYIDDFRFTTGYARYTAIGFAPPPTELPDPTVSDPYFANVTTLLHLNDTSFAIARAMNMAPVTYHYDKFNAIGTNGVQKKFGAASLYCDGVNQYISGSTGTDMEYGTNIDFTIEFWVNCSSTANSHPAIFRNNMGILDTGLTYFLFNSVNNPNKFWFRRIGGPDIVSTNTFSNDTWYHIAITRSGSTLRLFVNGALEASDGSATQEINFLGACIFGGSVHDGGSEGYFKGYIDEIRITKNVARYTAPFTAPTAAFPNW